jgi:hypothetical protein
MQAFEKAVDDKRVELAAAELDKVGDAALSKPSTWLPLSSSHGCAGLRGMVETPRGHHKKQLHVL